MYLGVWTSEYVLGRGRSEGEDGNACGFLISGEASTRSSESEGLPSTSWSSAAPDSVCPPNVS